MIALFDMDGTLFAGDSQLRFARWILRRHGWRRLYLLWLIPCGVLRALRIIDTPLMKRAFLAYAWRMKREHLEEECRLFCEQELMPAIFPELLERLRTHQASGDTTILCSASPDWWTQEMGRILGFSHTIGSPLITMERVQLMPALKPPGNNKGGNKLIRLERDLGITKAEIGYTDSCADLPMLTICERAVLVNPSARLCREHPEGEILRPAKKLGRFFILRCLAGL